MPWCLVWATKEGIKSWHLIQCWERNTFLQLTWCRPLRNRLLNSRKITKFIHGHSSLVEPRKMSRWWIQACFGSILKTKNPMEIFLDGAEDHKSCNGRNRCSRQPRDVKVLLQRWHGFQWYRRDGAACRVAHKERRHVIYIILLCSTTHYKDKEGRGLPENWHFTTKVCSAD